MAICKVIKGFEGWKEGDLIELFDERLAELKKLGIVEITIPDPEPIKIIHPDILETEKPKKKKKRKKVN